MSATALSPEKRTEAPTAPVPRNDIASTEMRNRIHYRRRKLTFFFLPVCLFWDGVPSCSAFLGVQHHEAKAREFPPLFDGAFGSTPGDKPRRKKKNKYAKNSAAPDKDPLELLMEESKEKLRQLNQESKPKTLKDIKLEEIEAVKKEPRNFAFPDNKDINPNEPASFGFIEIGTVLGPHGVHGEIKVKSCTGFPRRFTEPGIKYFRPLKKRAPRKVFLVSGKLTKDDEYIVQLDTAKSREEAALLRGGTLFVREEDREVGTKEDRVGAAAATEEEEEAEYFISDLVGLEVFLESDESMDGEEGSKTPFVGTVAGVVMTELPGIGHDMLEINLPRGKGGTVSLRDELVLIPFVPQIVPRVLIAEGSIYITPPEGLLDLTYVREEKVRIKGFLPSADDN